MTTNHQNPHIHQSCIEDPEDLLERLLEWSESTYGCDSLRASDLVAAAEKSGNALQQELARRYAAALGL